MGALTDTLSALFAKAGSATSSLGIGSDYYSRLAKVESNYNPSVVNSGGYTGLFQFGKAAWSDFGSGSLSNATNPSAATDAVVGLTTSNWQKLFGALGRSPSQGELYLAHQQGAGGAIALLSNPSANAASVVGYDAVVQNGGTGDMSAGDFASLWTSKFPGGPVSQNAVKNNHYEFDESQVPDNQKAGYSQSLVEYVTSQFADYFGRGAVIVLGFIFIAAGLILFKPAVAIIQKATK